MAAAAKRTKAPSPASVPKVGPGKPGVAASKRAAVGGVVKGPPGPAVKLDPKSIKDPRLKQALDKVERNAHRAKEHPPAEKKAAEAEAAAKPPPKEQLAGAQAKQVGVMKEAEVGKPQPDSFLTMLRAEIDKVMPKTLGETSNFMKGEKKEQVKGALTSNINQQKADSTAGMKAATTQAPDPSSVPPKESTPLPAPMAAPPAIPINAAAAMPLPKTEAEVSQQSSKDEATKKLADNELTPTQLQKANDPRFSSVLKSKGEVDKHADAAPKAYRGQEQKTLAQSAAGASAAEKAGLGAFHGTVNKVGQGVAGKQGTATSKAEAQRQRVVDSIQAVFVKTKAAVDGKLASLEQDANDLFEKGCETAVTHMKDEINRRLDAWKDDRYDRFGGSLLWAKDKLLGLPDSVNAFYDQGRQLLRDDLDALVVKVASLVEKRLAEAKTEVANGEKEIQAIVDSQPEELKSVALDAQKEVSGQFDDLRQGIEDKKADLAQGLAQKYKEAVDKGEQAIKAIQDENKSLLQRLEDAIREVIEVLRKFKDMLLGILREAVASIKLIIADPIGFLGNLLSAIKLGFSQFADNIWTHLKAGFMAWLFGSFASVGITAPKDFSIASIFKLVLQILGLTYDAIRGMAVEIIGERNVVILEKVWALVSALIKGGVDAFWDQVKEYVGDLKSMLVDAIQDWIITTVVKKAVFKLATMFNPAGAIIQAALMIISAVTFFVTKLGELLELVGAIVSSIHKIALGQIADAANWIEKALARTIPLLIGLLADLVGLSGVADKVKGFIDKVRRSIRDAIMKLIRKFVAMVKGLFGSGSKTPADGKDGAGDVREQATESLLKELAGEHTHDEAKAAAKRVEDQFKPQGLKHVQIGAEDEEGDYPISIEASPLTLAIVMRLARRGYSVRMGAEVTFVTPQTVQTARVFAIPPGRNFPLTARERREIQASNEPNRTRIQTAPIAEAGFLVDPSPAAESPVPREPKKIRSNIMHVVTFNRGNKDKHKDSNETHAETQFINWFKSDLDAEAIKELLMIRIQISRSPCSFCAHELCRFMTNHIRPHNPTAQMIIRFNTAHLGDNPTTVEDIAAMQGCGIDIPAGGITMTRATAGKESRHASPERAKR
jgi:hypothetical protein